MGVIIDKGKRTINWPDSYLGAERLLFCLRRYRRVIPKTTGEEASPVHDANSHAADAFGGLAEIAGKLRSEFVEQQFRRVAGFRQYDSGLGLLG